MTKILLAIASLSFLWVCCNPLNAQAKRLEPAVGMLPKEATGFGKTEDEARVDALKNALDRVRALMAAQKPPLESFDVREKDVYTYVEAGHAGNEVVEPGLDGRKQWVLPFRTDIDWWKEIVHRNRAEQRHKWTSQVLLGLTLLLLAGFSYVRLDEYTQRRYTTWLRVAGISVATSVAAGWWYIFQGS